MALEKSQAGALPHTVPMDKRPLWAGWHLQKLALHSATHGTQLTTNMTGLVTLRASRCQELSGCFPSSSHTVGTSTSTVTRGPMGRNGSSFYQTCSLSSHCMYPNCDAAMMTCLQEYARGRVKTTLAAGCTQGARRMMVIHTADCTAPEARG